MIEDVWGLSSQDSERLRSVLKDDERTVLVAKPRVKMDPLAAFGRVFPGLVLAGVCAYVAHGFGSQWWVAVLFFLPGWIFAIMLLSAPWRHRRRMERTLYVLTDKRAVVFEPTGWWRTRCVSWPLYPGLIKKVTKDGDCGSIIFDYEIRRSFTKRPRVSPHPVGFLSVPQHEEVRRLVEEQVATVPADKAPFAFRPSELSSPAPRLDAWGTPLSNQPWQKRADNAPLMAFGVVFALFASIFVVIGLVMLNTERLLEKEGVRTDATVLSVRKETSGGRNSSTTYYPTLRFTDVDGESHTIDYHINTDNYAIGSDISIIYLPSDPETLRVLEDGMSPGMAFTIVGSILVLVGCGIAFAGKSAKSKAK